MTRTTTQEITGGVRVVTPDSLHSITPYVLHEQQDWFEDEIVFLRRVLEPGQRAIDIGANYGVYALSIAKAVGPTGAVWAFEPTSSTAEFLAQGIAANNFTHVILERSALSRECGTAQLSLNDSSELNSLVRTEESAGASETVRVVTLDDCLERYHWENIDFVKIDAEGEEENILAGGRRFLTDASPLILFEVKAGNDWHLELVDKFAAFGFDSYRLVPGLDLLVPFNAASGPDGYLLNLFCCKQDRAAALCARGLLLTAASIAQYRSEDRFNDFARAHRHEYSWQDKLATLPYGAMSADLWESSAGEDAANSDALTCFAISQDVSLDPLDRFIALETSLRTLAQICQGQPTSLRFSSVARVARDFGARVIAVDALLKLSNKLATDEWVAPREPFLAPGKRFDTIAPRASSLQDWILAAVLEELERAVYFTSFFAGDSSRARLEILASLGYESDEMRRRLLLVRTRFPQS